MDLTQLEVRLLGVKKKYDFELPDELAEQERRTGGDELKGSYNVRSY
jgi:hypothetical protein